MSRYGIDRFGKVRPDSEAGCRGDAVENRGAVVDDQRSDDSFFIAIFLDRQQIRFVGHAEDDFRKFALQPNSFRLVQVDRNRLHGRVGHRQPNFVRQEFHRRMGDLRKRLPFIHGEIGANNNNLFDSSRVIHHIMDRGFVMLKIAGSILRKLVDHFQ